MLILKMVFEAAMLFGMGYTASATVETAIWLAKILG